MLFPGSVPRDPAVDAWMRKHPGPLGAIAQQWFTVLRDCGDDVRELLHDGHPTACVGDSAFAYVNAFTQHVNVGFFLGAELSDPHGLLQGTQNRHAVAVQIKLDELLRAVHGARTRLVNLEELSDEELARLHEEFKRLRERLNGHGEDEEAGTPPAPASRT